MACPTSTVHTLYTIKANVLMMTNTRSCLPGVMRAIFLHTRPEFAFYRCGSLKISESTKATSGASSFSYFSLNLSQSSTFRPVARKGRLYINENWKWRGFRVADVISRSDVLLGSPSHRNVRVSDFNLHAHAVYPVKYMRYLNSQRNLQCMT